MGGAFSSIPPGPGLSLRLSMVDVGALPDDRLLDFVHGQARQLAFQQHQLWEAIAEVAHRAPATLPDLEGWTPERVFDCAASQLTAELRISRTTAERELGYALGLEEMPQIAAALRAGELDRVKAVGLLGACRALSDEHRAKLLEQVLPDASSVRVSALKARVQRIAIALDPGWAERRYREAVREQIATHYLAEDGTVTVRAENQPPAQAMAALARLTRLAHAAKRAGAAASADVLRSVLCLGLAEGRFAGMTETQIIAHLVTDYPKTQPEPAGEPATSASPTTAT